MLPGSYARILVPLDGSADAEQVLNCVEPLAGKFGSTLLLLRATTPLDVVLTAMIGTPGVMSGANLVLDPARIMDDERQEAIAYLDNLGMNLRSKGIAVECIQEEGQPAASILKVAYQLRVDLIAMAGHSHRGLRRILGSFLGGGSVCDAVQRSAPCPVMVARVGESDVQRADTPAPIYRLRQSLRWVPRETLAS